MSNADYTTKAVNSSSDKNIARTNISNYENESDKTTNSAPSKVFSIS